ncbi:MAG TPA: nucleotidyltransferase family protein [Blastocatellia bacterium]
MSGLKEERAKWIASALRHSWRVDATPLSLTEDQLASITPLLIQSGAAGLVWSRAKISALKDTKSAARLRRAFLSQVIQATLREHELARLFACMRAARVEPIVVKGWATASRYPEKGLRPQGDIDLIVRPESLQAAQSVLNSPECEALNVDLEHREFARLNVRAFDELYERSRSVPLGGTEVRMLSAEDHLSFLCRHSLRHGAWRPLWLCDIALELENRPADFDWDLLRRRKREYHAVESAILLAHHLIDASLEGTPMAVTRAQSQQRADNRGVSLRQPEARGARTEKFRGVEAPAGPLGDGESRPPRWFIRAVLEQWEISDPMQHAPFNHLKPMASYLRDPSGIVHGLKARWPNPIEATISLGGRFNEVPRFPFQLVESILRTIKFLTGLARVGPGFPKGTAVQRSAEEIG